MLDTAWTSVNCYYTNIPTIDVCGIAQGSAINQRISYEIKPQRLDIAASILANSSAGAGTAVRMLVVQSYGAEVAAIPSVANILNDTGLGAVNSTLWMQKPYFQQRKLYHVLHDEMFKFTAFGGYCDLHIIQRSISLAGCRSVTYVDGAAALTSNAGGRIYVYFVSSEPVGNAQSLQHQCRLHYLDA